MPSLLIIEDEDNIIQLLKYNFEKEGFHVLLASDGEIGAQTALKKKPDLILLDLMLPKLDGLEVCKILRQNRETAHIPIIMLTAKSEELDKIIGLELGADDYVSKPFSPKELLARIKALLRRAKTQIKQGITLKAGDLEMNTDTYQVTLRKKPMVLTSKEFDLLRTLLEAHGRVLSRETLLEQVWNYERSLNIETRTIDMHIRQLRLKLKSEADRIVTVKNVGYRMELD